MREDSCFNIDEISGELGCIELEDWDASLGTRLAEVLFSNQKNKPKPRGPKKTKLWQVPPKSLGDRKHNHNAETSAGVNGISSNQTQEYFAIATETGFEILQNDSGSSRLKKKVQELNKNIALVEMMYKTNVIVLVYEQ